MFKRMKWPLILTLVLSLGLLMMASGCGSPEPPKVENEKEGTETSETSPTLEPLTLKFASMSIGGSWYIYAVNAADIFKPDLPKGSIVDVLPYQGGVANPSLVSEGDADLAIGFSTSSYWAYNGLVDYDGKSLKNLRALVGGLNRPHRLGIVVRQDLGIKSLQEVKDNKMKIRLITVQRGGAGETLARLTLDAYGMSYDDIIAWGGSVNHIDLPVAIQQVQDGQADIMIHNVGYKQPDFTELALRLPVAFLGIEPEIEKHLCDSYGYEPGIKVEKNEFKGVDEDVHTLGYPSTIFASDRMSDEIAYIITKAVCENKEKFAASHASLEAFEPSEAHLPEKNGFIPLHPGAEKYYKEKGWLQ